MAIKKSTKVVKKRWYKILGPSLLKDAEVGESYLAEPDVLIGKKMTVGLNSLTGEHYRYNTHANLVVSAYDDGVFRTDLVGWRMLPSAVKKMIRRNKSRIDDSFVVLTKDGKYVRVKPLVVTKNKAQNSVKTAILKKVRVEIAKIFSVKEFSVIVGEILGRRFQGQIARKLSKIFPVGIFDIRQLALVDVEKAKKMNIVRFVGEISEEEEKAEKRRKPKPKKVEKQEDNDVGLVSDKKSASESEESEEPSKSDDSEE